MIVRLEVCNLPSMQEYREGKRADVGPAATRRSSSPSAASRPPRARRAARRDREQRAERRLGRGCELSPGLRARLGGLRAIERFALAPASAAPLAALRIGLAAVLLTQAALVAPLLFDLYGPAGILQDPLRDAFTPARAARHRLADRAPRPARDRRSPDPRGHRSRLRALPGRARSAASGRGPLRCFAWSTHRMLMVTADPTVYGADVFASIFLFLSGLGALRRGAVLRSAGGMGHARARLRARRADACRAARPARRPAAPLRCLPGERAGKGGRPFLVER